jgi:hypothetical protein|tara:strand:- start:1513 stop:1833 length:321 start_codon:yes stop_codon:yes gene_type:complete
MGTYLNDVKASVELTSSGRLQGDVSGTSTNLGPCRIISINAHLTGADGEITIQDATTASGVIKIHLKGGSASNETLNFNFGGNGVKFDTAPYVTLANIDSFTAYYG